jgi:hypothetical protein
MPFLAPKTPTILRVHMIIWSYGIPRCVRESWSNIDRLHLPKCATPKLTSWEIHACGPHMPHALCVWEWQWTCMCEGERQEATTQPSTVMCPPPGVWSAPIVVCATLDHAQWIITWAHVVGMCDVEGNPSMRKCVMRVQSDCAMSVISNVHMSHVCCVVPNRWGARRLNLSYTDLNV